MSYEETLLSGELTEDQCDAIIDAYARTRDYLAISGELDIPVPLIRAALENGTLAQRAVRTKLGGAKVEFLQIALGHLLDAVRLPVSSITPTDRIRAIKLLKEILDDSEPAKGRGRPKKPAAKEESKPGSLERALRGCA